MVKVDQLNTLNIVKLLSIPAACFLLQGYPVCLAFLLGLATMDLFQQVSDYGVMALLLKPDPEIVRRVFALVEKGDLDELKRVTRKIPPADLIEMKQSGMEYSLLIKAVDSERRDIVRWLLEEIHAPVNQECKNETALLRAIFRNNELIVRDLLDHGANMDHKRHRVGWNLVVEAVMREKLNLFDVMLEYGASLNFVINGKPVDDKFIKKGSEFD